MSSAVMINKLKRTPKRTTIDGLLKIVDNFEFPEYKTQTCKNVRKDLCQYLKYIYLNDDAHIKSSVFVGGGFWRSFIKGEWPKDIDVFYRNSNTANIHIFDMIRTGCVVPFTETDMDPPLHVLTYRFIKQPVFCSKIVPSIVKMQSVFIRDYISPPDVLESFPYTINGMVYDGNCIVYDPMIFYDMLLEKTLMPLTKPLRKVNPRYYAKLLSYGFTPGAGLTKEDLVDDNLPAWGYV